MTDSIKGKYRVRRDEVARLMLEKGWTISSLAKAAEISHRSIKRLFQGEELRMTTIAPLAETLETTPLALIDGAESQARTEVHADGVAIDGAASQPPNDSQIGTLPDAPAESKESCFGFSFTINIPFALFREREHTATLLAEIGKQIHQMGALVIASAQPGSVRIICWATEKGDVDRFFSAFAEGRFDSLEITNPQILDDLLVEPEDDDKSQTAGERESTAPSSVPERSSSTNITGQTKPLESDAPLDEPESSSQMTADDRDALKAAAAGAAAGAIIGSAIPVVGTAIGGIIGGVLGGLFMKNRQAMSKSRSDDERGARPPKQKH